jgi:hypothetical protein
MQRMEFRESSTLQTKKSGLKAVTLIATPNPVSAISIRM